MKKLSLNFTKILLAMSVTVVTSCFSTPVNQNKKPVINVNKNSKPVLNNIATVPSQQPTNNNLEKSEINLIFDWSGIPDILLKNKTESISLRISGQDFSPNLYKELNISENLDLFTQGLKVEIPQGKDRQIEVLAMDKDKFPIARVINKLDISGNQNVNLSFEKIPENKVEFNNNVTKLPDNQNNLFSLNSDELIFSNNQKIPKTGDIIIGQFNGEPFARKVVSVTSTENKIVSKTVIPELFEVFKDLKIYGLRKEWVINDSTLKTKSIEENQSVTINNLAFEQFVSLDSFKIDAKSGFDFDFSDFVFEKKHLRIAPKINWKGSLEALVKTSAGIKLGYKKEDIGIIEVPMRIPQTGGLVKVIVKIAVFFDASGEVSKAVDMSLGGVQAQSSLKAGFDLYWGKNPDTIFSFPTQFNLISPRKVSDSLHIGAEIGAGFLIGVRIGLKEGDNSFGGEITAGPNFSFGRYLNYDLDNTITANSQGCQYKLSSQ